MRAFAAAYASSDGWRSRWSAAKFSHTAIHGLKVVVVSSWKLLVSTTWTVSEVDWSTCALSGVPIFPPTSAVVPAAASIRPMSVVVVDLPFVPVMAISRPFTNRHANSSSPMISTPHARAASNTGCSTGTPGLVTIKSADVNVSTLWPPSSSRTPSALRRSARSNVSRISVSVTSAPRLAASSAAAMPLRAAPTTTTRRPRTENTFASTPSPQLQRRQTEQRKDDRHDHKARDHLRLTPSDQFEVMVNRRHLEHALAGELEGGDLDDHRERFHDEHAADDRQQQFLLDQDRHGSQGTTERQRSHIAHEDVGGIRVVPEEPEACPDESPAKDRQLAGWSEPDEQQILREHGVSRDVRERRKCSS